MEEKKPWEIAAEEQSGVTEKKPWEIATEEAEGVKKKGSTTLEAGGTSTSALDGGKSDSQEMRLPTMKDLAVTGEQKVKQPVPPIPTQTVPNEVLIATAEKKQVSPNVDLYKKYEFSQSQYKKANEESNIFNSTFPESGVRSKNLSAEFLSEYELGKKKISDKLNQKKAIADATRKEISEKINTDVDRIYLEYGKELMQKSAIGKSVANKEKIQEISKEEARKAGLPENGYFATLLKTQLSAKAEWEEIKPEVENKFNEIYKKKYGQLPSEEQEQEFSSRLGQVESIKAKTKVAIEKLASEVSANSELPVKELGEGYKASIEELNKSIEADPEISKYQTDVVNAIVGQYQELVNSGKMTTEQANEFLKSDEFSKEVLDKTNQMVSDKYGAQLNESYANYLKALNQVKTKYNSQFVRQQEEILAFANKEIEKEYKKAQKEYKISPELEKKYKDAYGQAYKEVSEKKLKGEASIVEAQNAMVPFYTSTLSSLGSAFKGMGTTFGLSGMSDFGERLEANYATPDVGIKKVSDIFDATSFAVSSGQLVGRMAPGLVVGAGTAIATRNIPLAAQLAATGFAGWAAETSDMVGTMYNEVLEDTGDAAKANNAANKMLEAQTYMMPTYALEGLPFFGKALKGVPTVLGRAVVGAGIEFGTEMVQEIPQGAFEEAIKAEEDLGDFSKYITWEKSKQTMLQMAPIAVLGGGPVLYRGAKDYGVKKYAEAQAKSYVLKNDISGFLETSPEQFLFNVHTAKGTAFSKAFVSLMYSNGNISADEMTKLTEKVEMFDQYKEVLKKSKIKDSPEQVGFRVFSEYQEAKKAFESEENQDAKDILAEQLKTKKQDFQDFFGGKGVNLVKLKMQNGEEYVFSPEEMNEALKYENIRNAIKNKEIGISVYSKKGQEAVMKSVSDSMEILFQEEGKNVLITEAEAKEIIEAQRKQRDLEIEEFAVLRPDLTDADLLIMDIPEMVDKTIDRMDANIPTDPIQVEESIAALDKKFDELRAYKNDPKRTHSIAQIDEVIDLLSEAKTELQIYQTKNNEYESRAGEKTETGKAKPEIKVGETIKIAERKEGVKSGDSGIQEPVASVEEKIEVTGPSDVAGEPGQESGQEVGQEVDGGSKTTDQIYADNAKKAFIEGRIKAFTLDENGLYLNTNGVRVINGFKDNGNMDVFEASRVELTKDEKRELKIIEADRELGVEGTGERKRELAKKIFQRSLSEQSSPQNAPITNEGKNSEVVEAQGQKGPAANPSETDNIYDLSQEVTSNVSKENPEASILIQPKGDDLSLTAVYVGKEKRGKGIGSKVLTSVKKEADRVGKKVVLDATNELDEETDLVRLGKFYESNGFVKVGENKYEYNPKNALSEQKNENKDENKTLEEQIKNAPISNLKERIEVADRRIAENSGKLGKNQVQELMFQPPAVRLAYATSAYAFNKQRFKETLKDAQALVEKQQKANSEAKKEEKIKTQTDENQVNEEAEGREEGLLKAAETKKSGDSEPVSSAPLKEPEFVSAREKLEWLRLQGKEIADNEYFSFVANESNSPIEIIDAYLLSKRQREQSGSMKTGKEAVEALTGISITQREFEKHFNKGIEKEGGAEAKIKRFHVRKQKGSLGIGNRFSDLEEELEDIRQYGINMTPYEYMNWLTDYYGTNRQKALDKLDFYVESKDEARLADAFERKGFGKRLTPSVIEEYLEENYFDKLGPMARKAVLNLEAKTYEEAEQWFYDQIKSGQLTLDGDTPTSVVQRITEDRKREEDAKRSIAEAEERRQLNTPRNAIDVARIFRNDFGFTPWESTFAARMFDAKARLFAPILGLTREQYYQRYWLTSQSQDGAMDQETRKGLWSKEAAYAKRIIGMYQKADSTTAIHEILGHDYFDNIIQAAELGDKQSIEDLNTIVEEYIKEKKPKLSKAQVLKIVKDFNIETNYTEAGKEVHEWFATAAERYLGSGDQFKPEIANSKLGKQFEKFRQHVANLYQAMNKALIPPSPQMKKVFRRLFGEENFEVLDINDRVIQQAKEDNERVPVTEKASKLVGKLPTKVKKGLSQDEMTPEEILLEAAKDLIQSNESDKYNIVNDLKALVYKETGSKDYWPDIDDLKEQLEAIDKPDEGKIFNATIERALADRNVSPEIKKNLRSKEVRERDTYSLLTQISDATEVVTMVGPETLANLLLEEEGRADKQFQDYEFATLSNIVAKRLNAMKKGAPNRERRDQLTKLTTDLYDALSEKGSGISRALNSFRAWNLLDAEGMEMVIRRKMNKDNGKDTETAKQMAKKMEKEYEKLKKDFDYAFTGFLDSEEVRGRLEEEIAELNKKIEDFEKRKGQRTKMDSRTGKPITKGREFNPKFGIDDVKNFFKNKFRPGLSQEEVTEEDFKEAVADLLSRQKDYSFGSFVKVFNSQMGENYTAKELKDLYETTVDYMTDNGYEGGFSDIVEINDVILDETIVNDAAAAVVKRDLLVKHEKEMKAYMEKQRKAFIEDVANKMNNRELWEQYVNSVTAELVSKVAQNLGTGSNTDKALLDEFTSLVKTAIKEKLDEVLPVANSQPVQKTAKELAENIADLANNEEKFADVFDAMVEKLQEKYKNDVNAVNALQALANIQNPFSDKMLSKAVSKQFEGTGWKLGDVAFGRGTGLMASQMAQQVLFDGGLLGTPAEAVLRPLLEDAFKKNAKKFEGQTLDSLANYIVNDAKKAVGAVSPANKTFVEEMVGALKRKVRENYKANNKTAPADPMELIKFALKETGKADQVGGSLWSQAQGEVIGKIMADPNLTQGQKMDAIDFLRDFSNSVFDTIVPVTTLERAIVRQLKKSGIALDANGNIPWESLIKGVDGQIDALREQVELAIRAELGNNYNPALVDLMVNRIVDHYDSMITEKKKAMFEKQLASFSSEVSLPYVKDRKIGGMVGKLLAMDKSGLLDAQAFNDLVSEYMGIKSLSMQEWNELQYLLRQIEDSPEGFERVTAIENVTLFLESKQPMYGAKVMRAIYYANLLSGFSTAIKNLTGIFDVFFKAVGESALQLDPTYLKLALKGLSQGDFADIIKRGSANQGDKVDIPTDSMGLAHVNTLERWRKYPGLRNKVFGSLAYVSRVLNATDAAVQRSVQEQSDYYLTKKDLKFKNPALTTKAIREMALANMFRDDITFQKAVEMAVDEMNARGMNVNKGIVLSELSKNPLRQNEDTVRAKRRAYEIMRKNRLDEVRVYSGKDALKTAFKTEFEDNKGIFTGMGKGLMSLFEIIGRGFGGLGEFLADRLNTSEAKKKAIKESFAAMPQTLIMPIIRGVSNVAEVSAEKLLFYGPLKGTVKYFKAIDDNNKNFKKISKAMTTNERIEFEYKKMQALDMITSSLAANLFVGVVTAMLMEAVPDDDEKYKNGFYAAGSSVNIAKRGEKAKMVVIPENSIVIGGEIYSFSWFGTMALSLSAYANYEETKNNEDFGIADFMLGTLSGFLSASMFEPVSRFSEVVSPKFKTDKTMGERVVSWMENIGLSAVTNTFMPWSNMQAQIAQGGKMIFKDGTSEDAIGVYEKMVKKMPLLQLIPGVGYDRPSLDYTGDPIPMEVKNPGSAASLFQWAQDRKIPEFKTYDAKIGLNTPFNGKTLDNTIAKETMTDEQYYDYRKDVSVAFKPFQEANFKNLNQYDVTPPENANGDITLATRKKQQEVAISMFGLPYSKLSGSKKNDVNRALNYREASEKAHAAIERYFGKVYMKELGISVDIEEARNDLDTEIYDVLPDEMSNADRQDIADRVLRSSRR